MTKKKIAYIGAGPATLYSIQTLLKLGEYDVEVFDMNDRAGGACYTGIPQFRFNTSFIDKLMDELTSAGVTFHFQTTIGKDIPFSDLQKKFDRIVVAIGAQVENMFGLEAKGGCIAGLTLLHDLNIKHMHDFYKENYKHAVVWGGGNVAMDCSRSLVRIMDDVKIIYRRSEAEMPAHKGEIKDARNEGVTFHFLENIKEVLRDETGKVTGVKVITMELGESDESGRRSTHELEGSEHIIPCDLVVAAIGQKVDFSILDENLNLTSGQHQSTIENVLIVGDAYLGPQSIAAAIKDGREVAKEVHESFIETER